MTPFDEADPQRLLTPHSTISSSHAFIQTRTYFLESDSPRSLNPSPLAMPPGPPPPIIPHRKTLGIPDRNARQLDASHPSQEPHRGSSYRVVHARDEIRARRINGPGRNVEGPTASKSHPRSSGKVVWDQSLVEQQVGIPVSQTGVGKNATCNETRHRFLVERYDPDEENPCFTHWYPPWPCRSLQSTRPRGTHHSCPQIPPTCR